MSNPNEAAFKCDICGAWYLINRKEGDQSKCAPCKAEALRAAKEPTATEIEMQKLKRANAFRSGDVGSLLPLPEKETPTS